MDRKFFLPFLMILILSYSTVNGSEADLENYSSALNIIKEFALDYCPDPDLKGSSSKLEISGKAQLELSKLLKRIGDLGFEAATNYSSEEFNGVLQEDLASLVEGATNCRLAIWADLQKRLLDAAKKNEQVNTGNLEITKQYLWQHDDVYIEDKKSERYIETVYYGEYINSNPNGYGRLVLSQPSQILLQYEGYFKNGEFHGKGSLEVYNKWRYGYDQLEGEFENGEFIEGNADVLYEIFRSPRAPNAPLELGGGFNNHILKGSYSGQVISSREAPNSVFNDGRIEYYYDYLEDHVIPNGKGVFNHLWDRDEPSADIKISFDGYWEKGAFSGSGTIYFDNNRYQRGKFLYGYQISGTAKNINDPYNWQIKYDHILKNNYSGKIVNSEVIK